MCQIIFKNNSELRALEKLELSLDFESVDGAEIPEIAPKDEIDPALKKIAEDRAKAVAMPSDIREKLAQLRKGIL